MLIKTYRFLNYPVETLLMQSAEYCSPFEGGWGAFHAFTHAHTPTTTEKEKAFALSIHLARQQPAHHKYNFF